MSLKDQIGKLAKVEYRKGVSRYNWSFEEIGVIQKVARVSGTTDEYACLVRYYIHSKRKTFKNWFHVKDCKLVEHDEIDYSYTRYQYVRDNLQYGPAKGDDGE